MNPVRNEKQESSSVLIKDIPQAAAISNGMKIVLATPLYPPDIGGPGTYAKTLFEGLPKKGVEIELVKFGDVRRFPKGIRHLVYYRKLINAAKNADALFALDPVSVGLPALRAAQKTGKPFFVKIVGDYAWEQGRQRFGVTQELDAFVHTEQTSFFVRRLQAVQMRVAAAATRIIVPSTYLKGIVHAWGISEEKIDVIFNAVPQTEVGTVPQAVQALSGPMLVTAGRLVPWKGMEGVIAAVATLRARGKNLSLVVIGEGPDRALLEAKAKEVLHEGYVFTGALSHKDALAVMQAGTLFVLNSTYEGLSHFLIETRMLGIPTIATNVGGNTEVITANVDGLLVPSGDAPALVHAIQTVLENEALRTEYGTRAREAFKRFSEESMLTATADILARKP